ncbi:iron chaperone [Phenylobacterium immobile]|uniref:iron chaperone n=1 Tax=Phenylobacterium immobile TaxID=21 RepID=UPI000B08B9F3|nr:DUF1801 domain-containing protein [Phenylobacterium immobile]
MSDKAPANVDAYIAAAPQAAQAKLAELRDFIRATLPHAEERIWYRVPFYWVDGRELTGLSVAKAHVTFGFPLGALSAEDRAALKAKGYKTGKQTLQIGFEQALPKAEIKRALRPA